MTRSRCWFLLVVALALALALPATAMAFVIQRPTDEATQNAYGLWYAPAKSCANGETCHSAIVAKPTVHSTFVTDISLDQSKLLPAAGKWLASFGIGPADIFLQLGDRKGLLQYTGFSVPSIKPSDDISTWGGVQWENTHQSWLATGTATRGASGYSQSCSGCHNTGVTRPSNQEYKLANKGTQSPMTPSGMVDAGIGCQVCHGSGQMNGLTHFLSGAGGQSPRVVGGVQVLKSQVCGQCHVTGVTKEKNVAGAAFGQPNGYTTDESLSDYLTALTQVPTEEEFQAFLASAAVNPATPKPQFLPNGANYSMRHSYYNEWLVNKVPSHLGDGKLNGHANPVNGAVIYNPKCLGCHSGLGFLNRIGAKDARGKVLVEASMISTTNDIGISCQVCHGGHVTYKANGDYDLARKWGNGKSVDCGDCHNWQFEVLGQATQTEIVGGIVRRRPAADNRSRHPQREMRAGGSKGGMWGVGVVADDMAKLACAACHMPRTHKEGFPANDNGDEEATRMSHRFHVVEPEDAIKWKLRKNGDSCTVECHEEIDGLETREDMQEWMDEERAAVKVKMDAAKAVLNADAQALGLADWNAFLAAKPSAGAAATLTAGQWKTLQKAAQNIDFVEGDASGGLHNPKYAKAGLDAAVRFARTPLVTNSPRTSAYAIKRGKSVRLAAVVKRQSGVLVASKRVVFQKSRDRRYWTDYSTHTTGNDGSVSKSLVLKTAGTYYWRWKVTADGGYKTAYGPIVITVVK